MKNRYREELLMDLENQCCPDCGSKNIWVDNWGMFKGKRDWFYYCKDCDYTFRSTDIVEEDRISYEMENKINS